MKKLILLPFLISSCGTTEPMTGSQPMASAQPATQTFENLSPTDSPVTVAYEKVGEEYALSLPDQTELPVCDQANDRQLAYTLKENLFYACEEGVWTNIDVHGQAGAQGTVGAQGPKGDKGDPGQPVDPNQWLDPITDKTWLIGGIMLESLINYNIAGVCSNGWRLGTIDELQLAANHGIVAVAHTLNPESNGLWSGSGHLDGSGTFQRGFVDITTMQREGQMTGFSVAAACLHD